MKSVTLTVVVNAIVEDDAIVDELCLFLPNDGVEITDSKGKKKGNVENYETTNVVDND